MYCTSCSRSCSREDLGTVKCQKQENVSSYNAAQGSSDRKWLSVSMAARRRATLHILNNRHPSVKYPPGAQHCSFACPLTLRSAVHFPHQACRPLTAVSCSSLWLIAQQEVNNMAQAWCDSEASAKTPALTIYNTLEASRVPTLPSYSVGSTSFSGLPLSFSSPVGSAILVTKLLLCNWLSGLQWNKLWFKALSCIQCVY